MKILISDSAFNYLKAIINYYADEGVPHIGNEFVNNIISHIHSLKENPDIGRKVPEFNENNIRELIHIPYRIVYLREEKLIHVVRVWRSERLLNLDDTPANTKI